MDAEMRKVRFLAEERALWSPSGTELCWQIALVDLGAAELNCGVWSGEDPWPSPGALDSLQPGLELGFLSKSCSSCPAPLRHVLPAASSKALQLLFRYQQSFKCFVLKDFFLCFISAKPFESGQYLDIYGITRDQAGEYECSAENDVSVPDVKKVKVTVNCKSSCFLFTKSK